MRNRLNDIITSIIIYLKNHQHEGIDWDVKYQKDAREYVIHISEKI